MVTLEHIKPFLLHEDNWTRWRIIEFLEECGCQDEDVPPLVIQASSRYGMEAAQELLCHARHLAWTAEPFESILAWVAEKRSTPLHPHLNTIVAHAPLALLRGREDDLRQMPNVESRTLKQVQRRLELAEWSGERLWEELQAFDARSRDKRYVGEIDHAYAGDLIEALARHNVPDEATLCSLLQADAGDGYWLETFLVDLAGARRVSAAVPALVQKFHIDTDYLLERCMFALGLIGDPLAARLIREAYPTAEDCFQLFCSGALERIKHPESEDAVLALLEGEEDIEARTRLCLVLCKLFSEHGVPVVHRQIEEGYDSFLVDLRHELLAVLTVHGLDLPEAAEWRRDIAEEERARQERLARMTQGWARRRQQPAQTAPSPPTPAQRLTLEGTGPLPFRHDKPRAGRNDPCPCGSGKKFKKCCGRNA